MKWITLDEELRDVDRAAGIVYSTAPKTGKDYQGDVYFFKGPASKIVFAECVAYQLAELIDLEVPEWALCRHPGTGALYFASKGKRLRSAITSMMSARSMVTNLDFLASMIAFDVWICNRDRNEGGIVAEPIGGRNGFEVRLFAIDFEKSDILSGVSRFEVAKFKAADCFPQGVLRPYCKGLRLPATTLAKICSLSLEQIRSIFKNVADEIGGSEITWVESASDYLAKRTVSMESLLTRAWHG